jgi:hypothetical protein
VHDGEFRGGEGAPFKAAITTADASSDLERILLSLGRSPDCEPIKQP